MYRTPLIIPIEKCTGHEWRLLKLFHKKGLLLPIKDLLRKFIGKETIQCLTNPSAKWQEKLQKTI